MKDSKMAIKCNQTLSMHKREVYEIFLFNTLCGYFYTLFKNGN